MNRFWVRLSFYFSLFILIGVLLLALLPRLLLNFSGASGGNRPRDELVANLAALYTQNGNWSGISETLRSFDAIIPRGFGGEPSAFIFADQDGYVLYDGTGQHKGTTLTPLERQAAVAITTDGVIRGYLMLQTINFTPPPGTDPNFFLRGALNGFAVFAAMAGIIGIATGILISRQLTAPLSELAETVRSFRNPNSSKQAAVKGTDEVREVATAFNEMVAALAEAERLRRNLVGDVAHELRTPLTVLQANIQAILDDLYPLNKTEIQNLQSQTDLLQTLVNDLHQLAQAEAHQLPLHIMAVNFNELVESLVEHFNAVSQTKGLTLIAKVPNTPVVASIDPDRIAQVLQNLIQNALNHTPQGGTITVILTDDEHHAVISVKDTGDGISQDDQQRIFERFYRTDEARSRASGGAGLGLPIAKAIIEMHHGTVRVSSDGIAGHGTLFTIAVPKTQPV